MYKVNYYSSFLRTITQPTRYKPKSKTFFSTCSLHIYLLLFFPFPFSHPPQFFFIIFFFRFLSLDSSFLLSSVFPTLTNCLSLSLPLTVYFPQQHHPPRSLLSSLFYFSAFFLISFSSFFNLPHSYRSASLSLPQSLLSASTPPSPESVLPILLPKAASLLTTTLQLSLSQHNQSQNQSSSPCSSCKLTLHTTTPPLSIEE